ncbi:MAG: hypothetical protein ACRD10_01195, partial [Terriglobia bacterium]
MRASFPETAEEGVLIQPMSFRDFPESLRIEPGFDEHNRRVFKPMRRIPEAPPALATQTGPG